MPCPPLAVLAGENSPSQAVSRPPSGPGDACADEKAKASNPPSASVPTSPAEPQNPLLRAGLFAPGEKLPFCTLLPSFIDRAAYFEIIVAGALAADRRRLSCRLDAPGPAHEEAACAWLEVGSSSWPAGLERFLRGLLSPHAQASLQGQVTSRHVPGSGGMCVDVC